MKIEKNKVVIGSILAFVVIFIVSYAVLVLGDDSEEFEQLNKPTYRNWKKSRSNTNRNSMPLMH